MNCIRDWWPREVGCATTLVRTSLRPTFPDNREITGNFCLFGTPAEPPTAESPHHSPDFSTFNRAKNREKFGNGTGRASKLAAT